MGDQIRTWPWMDFHFLPAHFTQPSVLPLVMEWAWQPSLPLGDHRLQQARLQGGFQHLCSESWAAVEEVK